MKHLENAKVKTEMQTQELENMTAFDLEMRIRQLLNRLMFENDPLKYVEIDTEIREALFEMSFRLEQYEKGLK